ncbi:MAG: SlyX family protein [bacterium]|nr:SlyX family protein [bacterium]
MEERIIELETRVAYQDKLLSDLDEVVQAFAKRVEKVEQRLSDLQDRQPEHQAELEPHNTPPPHY